RPCSRRRRGGSCVPGVEGDREQAALTAARHARVDVEEGSLQYPPPLDHADHAALLDGVEPARLARGRGEVGQLPEGGGDDGGRSGEGKDAGKDRGDHASTVATRLLTACQDASRTLRSSSSFPGGRMARTWSPGRSFVESSAISNWPFRLTEIR